MQDSDAFPDAAENPTDDLDLEFIDDPAAKPKARPVARAVAKGVTLTQAGSKKKASAKKPTVRRAVAKAVVKKAPKKRPVAKTVVAARRVDAPAPDAKPEPAEPPLTFEALPKLEEPAPRAPRPDPRTLETYVPPPDIPKPPPQVVARAEVDPKALMRQALRHHNAGDLGEARSLYTRILRIDPDFGPAWINLGVLLRRIGQTDPAVTCLKRGVALRPDDGPAWSNLGNALRSANRYDEALAAQRKALEISPDVARIHYNTGLTIRDKGNLNDAYHAMRRAGLLGYDAPELPWDMALTLLLAGNLRQGLAEYEARWTLAETQRLHTHLPEWNGEPLNGRTLLVWAEQGIGDSIQFCRYLTDDADGFGSLDGKVVLDIQPPLARLLRHSPGFSNITVVPRGQDLPEADLQVPLLSLARLRGTELDTIPDHCPYLAPPPDAAKPKGMRPGRLKVGICWAGKPTHKNDRNRSIDLGKLAPLFDLPGTDFFALQKGPAATQLSDTALDSLLHDLGRGFGDFADTAATLRELDLLITVDTSIAHLAGAMARPVWVLLPYAPDWRWMLHRDDSPWYPSMTLFRQTSPGDWTEVVARIRHALIRKLRANA